MGGSDTDVGCSRYFAEENPHTEACSSVRMDGENHGASFTVTILNIVWFFRPSKNRVSTCS